MHITRLFTSLRPPSHLFHGLISSITSSTFPSNSNDSYKVTTKSHTHSFPTKLETCTSYLKNARLVCEDFGNPNISAWNTMLRAYANNGEYKEVLKNYYKMMEKRVQPNKFTFLCALKACSTLYALEEGKGIQEDIVRNGLESDVFVSSALVAMYAKCRRLRDARHVFDKMTQRDVVSWNAMIAGYVQNKQGREALDIFREMVAVNGVPDPFTAASILSAIAQMADSVYSKEVHAFVIRCGFMCDVFVGTALIDAYGKCGSVGIARRVFDRMPQRNLISWNAMIAGYAQNGVCNEALELFREMEACGVKPNLDTASTVILACSRAGDLVSGKEIHSCLIKRGFESDVFAGSALVAMYAKYNYVEDAYRVFDKMSHREVASWNSMISGYVQNGYFVKALKLFAKMKFEWMEFDYMTISSALSACAHLGALPQGKEIHNHVIRNGFEANAHVGSALVTMYAKCQRIEEAHNVFNSIDKKDVVAWSGIIAGLAQRQHSDKALKCFQDMQFRAVQSDSYIIASVLSACAQLSALRQGKEIHNHIIRNGLESDVYAGSALVDMYAKCGNIELAQKVFWSIPHRNVVSWNAMIAGYSQNGHLDEALEFFREMQLKEVKFDSVTMVGILPACAFLAALQQGKEIHAHTYRRGFIWDVFVGHALIDVYAKCGSINYARQVFDRMPQTDTVAWNVMISAYGMHGYGEDALTLFHQMKQKGILPDHITFITVLSACSHAGLVEKGCECIECMSQDYHIQPRIEHFQCMVDLLGRAGRLDDAYGLIQSMPFRPDAGVWGALLGACRIHCNVELGELAAEHLFELEPANTGYYVLLSNLYAQACRWDDVAKMKTMMKGKRLKKSPGWSWIKVKNKVHMFLVGDRSHPDSEKIYAVLKSLNAQMRDTGYVPDTTCFLHNVEEE